ncbi:MAG: hypothetical protein SCALA701_25810 [Candidatus Scalindua sp.]|nr:S49 family peptidase [Planctomycetota bacterium]GJQ59780.1 MAG: hypothetical protein SCALA701_25810 [Candidatus Scalindua sp.]
MKTIQQLPSMWSILPEELDKIKSSLEDVKAEDIAGFFEDEKRLARFGPSFFTEDNVGVMQIEGVIQPKMDIWAWIFGGATLDIMTRDFNTLIENENIESIILDIDSPGGVVFCVQEFANLVFEARERKHIIAVTSSMMTSAAYWIGAAAHEVFVTDEAAITGSIGVVVSHVDVSELEKRLGIKTTEITAGSKKRITSRTAPLTEEGRAELQRQVDHLYDAFVQDIATFRGVNVEVVLSEMADGQIFLGSQGVEAGLVDEVVASGELLQRVKEAQSEENIDSNFQRGAEMTAISKTKKTKEVLTADRVKENYPEVYDEIFTLGVESNRDAIDKESFDAGHAEGEKVGRLAGISEGAKSEAERIKAVEGQSLPGHEALVEKLKYDGKTTGEQAAVTILAAEKNRNAKGLNTLANEAVKPVDEEAETNEESDKKDFKTLVAEYQAEHKCTKTDAMKAVAKSHPEEHAAYIAA